MAGMKHPPAKCRGEDLVLRCLAPMGGHGRARSRKYYLCSVKDMTSGMPCGGASINPTNGTITWRGLRWRSR